MVVNYVTLKDFSDQSSDGTLLQQFEVLKLVKINHKHKPTIESHLNVSANLID